MRKNSVKVGLPVETAFEPMQVLGIRVELMAAFSCLIFAILCTCKISRILASEEDEYRGTIQNGKNLPLTSK